MIEAIEGIEAISGHKLNYTVGETNRIGDHIWYVSDIGKFKNHYPDFAYEYDMDRILREMITAAEAKMSQSKLITETV